VSLPHPVTTELADFGAVPAGDTMPLLVQQPHSSTRMRPSARSLDLAVSMRPSSQPQ
jgi:hypothetical protein